MLWPDSTSRTASCLNSSVYLPFFPFLTCISLCYYSLRDTSCAGEVNPLVAATGHYDFLGQ